jgi:hypothetical protein
MAGVGTVGMMAIDTGGQWSCGGEGDPDEVDFTLQPNQTVVDPFWLILPQVLSNQRPTMQQIDLNSLVFNPGLAASGQLPYSYQLSGPSLYKCSFGTVSLPFASRATSQLPGESCTKAAAGASTALAAPSSTS